MCEQTEVQYLEGDVVWVKLGSCWWPAEVQDIKKLPEEVQEDLRRDPIAAVKFFDENKYEYVHKLDQICMYNCRRKTEFIKKGLDMYRTKKKEGSSFMDKFPTDVAKAESMTGGDPEILSDSEFAPKEKTTWKSIFGEDKKPSSPTEWFTKSVKGNKSIICTQDIKSPKPVIRRRITHPRLLRVLKGEEEEYEVRIRLQPSANIIESEQNGPYHCPTCDFTSNRLNVIILHNKYHTTFPQSNRARGKGKNTLKTDGTVGSLTGKGSSKGRIKQFQNSPPVDESSEKECYSECETSAKLPRGKDKASKPEKSPERSTSQKPVDTLEQVSDIRHSEKKPERKTIFGKRKGFKKKELPAKKKKTNEEIREKLLADWEDDEDHEQEKQEIELLKQVLNKNCSNESANKAKEMSCFDFDESADSMLDVELEERAKKFAENLRFPRVTEDRDSLQKQKLSDVKQSTHVSVVEKEPITGAHKVSVIPEIHFSEKGNSEIKSVESDNCQKNHKSASGILYTSVIVNTKDALITAATESEEAIKISNDRDVSEIESVSQPTTHLEKDCEMEIKEEELGVSEDLTAEFESVMAETAIPDLPTIPENKILTNRVLIPEHSIEETNEKIDVKEEGNFNCTKSNNFRSNFETNEGICEEDMNESPPEVSKNDIQNEEAEDPLSIRGQEDSDDLPGTKSEVESISDQNVTQLSSSEEHPFVGSTDTDSHFQHAIKKEDPWEHCENSKNSEVCVSENNSYVQYPQSETKQEHLISNENFKTVSNDTEENKEATGTSESESSEVKSEVLIKEEADTEDKLITQTSEAVEDPLAISGVHSSDSDVSVKSEPVVAEAPHKEMEQVAARDISKTNNQETDLLDADELDINSMPVVMTDAFIKEELDTRESVNQFSETSSVVVSAASIVGQQSAGSVFIAPSSESIPLMVPVSSVKTTTGGNTVVKIIKSTTNQGTNVSGLKTILPNKPGSKYVIIQQASGQQQRFQGKALQQCVTLKTLPQPQGNGTASKKLLIMKTSQTPGSPGVQSVLTSSSKISAIGQRVITSSGAIVTTVPSNKTVLPKGAKLLPLPQQHLKVVTGGTKQRLTMQSTKTKVSLPSMQSLRKVNVLPAPTGKIVGTSKSKSNTILIHSSQSTSSVSSNEGVISSNHSNQTATQVALKPQFVRSKAPLSPSGTSLQRVLITSGAQPTLQTQQRPLVTKMTPQPRMLVQKVQIPKSGTVVVSSDVVKKGIPLLTQNQAGQKTGQVSNTVKILPQTQQKTSTQTVQPKGRILTVQNAKQKLSAKSLQPLPAINTIGIAQPLPTLQLFQQTGSAEVVTQPLVVSENAVSSSSSPVTTSTAIQQSPPTGSILTSEQLAQMMGASGGQIATEAGTLVLVTINESGNLQPLDNSTLVAYDNSAGQNTKPANALYIDSSTLGSQNDLDKLIFTLNNQVAVSSGLVNMEQQSSPPPQDQQSSVFHVANGSKAPAPGCNQDILAAALANTDVFQPDTSNVVSDPLTISHSDNHVRLLEPSSILNVSSTTLHQATMLLPSVTTAGLPPAAPGVLETSLTLNQPIMTPLEVPSSVSHIESPPPPPPPSTSIQLTQSSLIIPPSGLSPVNYVSETASSLESPVSTSVVMSSLPNLASVELVSDEASAMSHMQTKTNQTLNPSSLETIQENDELLPTLNSASEDVTISGVTEKQSSDYLSVVETASPQVPELSSPQETGDGNNIVDSECQQMSESTSESGYTKLTEQAVSTSHGVETKGNSELIGSSVQITGDAPQIPQQLDSSSEALDISAADKNFFKEQKSQQHVEDASSIDCVESTSENVLFNSSVSAPHVNDIRNTEGTSDDLEETNSSVAVTGKDERTVTSVWSENESNPETDTLKDGSER